MLSFDYKRYILFLVTEIFSIFSIFFSIVIKIHNRYINKKNHLINIIVKSQRLQLITYLIDF